MAEKFTAGRAAERRAHRRRPPDVRDTAPSRLCVPGGCAACSPSRCSARASMCPTSTPCCCSVRLQSATVFTQQLGRGLRRAAGKSHLTVIDLIGQHRREFRFEDRLGRSSTPPRTIVDQVDADFPFLPAGCTVDLDRQSARSCSTTSAAAVRRSRWTTLVDDLARRAIRRLDWETSWSATIIGSRTSTAAEAGRDCAARRPGDRCRAGDATLERRTLRALGRLTHIDDPERVATLPRRSSRADTPPR